jgi:hypothetical protein
MTVIMSTISTTSEVAMIVVDSDDSETLCCQLCQKPFTSLETAWLMSPPTGGEGRWVHKRCVDGSAAAAFGLDTFRLRRGDFVLKSLVHRLWVQTI